MLAQIIKKLTFFLGNPEIDSFHSTMFHGEGEYRGDAGATKLHLTLNAFKIAPVFKTRLYLVVTEAVASEIRLIGGFTLRPVVVEKIVYIPYKEGVFDHWENPEFEQGSEMPELALCNSPSREDLRSSLPDLFEVIAEEHEDVAAHFSDCLLYQYEIGPTEFDEKFEASLSSAMLQKFPILWHPICLIVSGDLMNRLQLFIDWRYFLRGELNIRV